MIALMILTALIVYIAVAWLVIKRLPSKKSKWIAAVVFVLIPTWDEILGRTYFKYLCETESGMKVYKTIELPAEYWNSNGAPKFIDQSGRPGEAMLGNRYTFSWETDENYSRIFRIKKSERIVKETHSEEAVGRYTSFVFFGGWVANNSFTHVVGTGCPSLKEYDYRAFLKRIFKPVTAEN